MDNALASEAGNTGSIPVGGNIFGECRMIPWHIRFSTTHSADEVLLKIIGALDAEVGIFEGPSKKQTETPTSRIFAGSADYSNHSFKLLYAPRAWSTIMQQVKYLYQGRAYHDGGTTWISLWVRPTFGGLLLFGLILLVSYVAVKKYLSGNYEPDYPKAMILFAGMWCFLGWRTWSEVRKARQRFADLLSKAIEKN